MKYVYLLKCGHNTYKVGIATDVARRMASLQTANPWPINLVTFAATEEAALVERAIHRRLQDFRAIDGGTEWFALTAEQAVELAILIHQPGNLFQVVMPVEQPIEEQALRVFKRYGRASTSLLQRELRIGYSKAARIMDALEAKGAIGPLDGARPRHVISR